MTGTGKEPEVSGRPQMVMILMTNTVLKQVHTNQTGIRQLNMTGMAQKSEHTRRIQTGLQLLTTDMAEKQDHLKQILREEQPNMTDTEEKSGVINNLQ